MYYIYILRCADDTLYTGFTNNIENRMKRHNSSTRGAKYTRIRRPVTVVYSEQYGTKSEAMKREYEIKQMTRTEKLRLL